MQHTNKFISLSLSTIALPPQHDIITYTSFYGGKSLKYVGSVNKMSVSIMNDRDQYIHFSLNKNLEIDDLYSTFNEDNFCVPNFKPSQAFWFSDEKARMPWSQMSSMFGDEDWLEKYAAYAVSLDFKKDILLLSSADDIDRFTEYYSIDSFSNSSNSHTDNMKFMPNILGGLYIDWTQVAKQYKGLLISPYIFERRIYKDTAWYYTWDCASGCVWDVSCILRLEKIDFQLTDRRDIVKNSNS